MLADRGLQSLPFTEKPQVVVIKASLCDLFTLYFALKHTSQLKQEEYPAEHRGNVSSKASFQKPLANKLPPAEKLRRNKEYLRLFIFSFLSGSVIIPGRFLPISLSPQSPPYFQSCCKQIPVMDGPSGSQSGRSCTCWQVLLRPGRSLSSESLLELLSFKS